MVFTVDLSTGKITNSFGGPGSKPGLFRDPSGIVCDLDGYIIVGDSRNHRIQVNSLY